MNVKFRGCLCFQSTSTTKLRKSLGQHEDETAKLFLPPEDLTSVATGSRLCFSVEIGNEICCFGAFQNTSSVPRIM